MPGTKINFHRPIFDPNINVIVHTQYSHQVFQYTFEKRTFLDFLSVKHYLSIVCSVQVATDVFQV